MATILSMRDRLIQAAVTEFQANGYHGTGLAAILHTAKAPKGSLYHHFPDGKEQLALAALQWLQTEVRNFLNVHDKQHADGKTMLREMARQSGLGLDQAGQMRGSLVAILAAEAVPSSLLLQAGLDDTLKSWAAILANGARRMGVDNPEQWAWSALAQLEGATVIGRISGGSGRLTMLIETWLAETGPASRPAPLPENLVTISHGNHAVGIEPDFGGSMAFWRYKGRHILRPTSDAARKAGDILAAASFAMVPFSNRISGSRFIWDAREICLRPNLPGFEHIIHGTGFLSQWRVDILAADRAELLLQHSANESWPWNFQARQTFVCTSSGVKLGLELENRSNETMPAGMGFHPAFLGQDAMLQFKAATFWTAGADMLPVKAIANNAPHDFTLPQRIKGHDIDNCYGGWNGEAEIIWPDPETRITLSSSARDAVLYIPKGEQHFCFEPVNHVNNALNLSDDAAPMPSLAPGETATLTFDMMIA